MTYPVLWGDIPDETLDNFKRHCGYPSSTTFEQYIKRANIELKPFNGYWENDYYIFESEAHYQWFLLRWS